MSSRDGQEKNPKGFNEAVDTVVHALRPVRGVKSVILFGSTARGTATADGDIDIFIECESRTEEGVRRILNDIDDRFGVAFSPIFFRAKDFHLFDKQFLESIVRHGRV